MSPRRHRLRWITLTVAGALALGLVATYAAYRSDMRAREARMAAESRVVDTAHGPIEVAIWGSGPPVLVVHGAGGGYDQGRLIADAYGGEGFRWIAPSRFGYLRSPLPDDASTTAQAHAFAALLDALGIERVGVLAMSGGAPPALQLAGLYPERVTALVLLSPAPYAPLTAEDQEPPLPIWAYEVLFGSDLPFWLLSRVAMPLLEQVFDVPRRSVSRRTPQERAFIAGMIETFLPVTRRTGGVANEGAAIAPSGLVALDAIAAPTLVVHARDDGLAPFSVGAFTAAGIRGAELMALPDGRHLMIGHMAEISARVSGFLIEHAAPGDTGR